MKNAWQHDDHDEKDHDEGECHRHAPRPTLGTFEHEVLKHLTTLSWNIATEEQKSMDFDSWEEAQSYPGHWPVTQAKDWCGDWRKEKRQWTRD